MIPNPYSPVRKFVTLATGGFPSVTKTNRVFKTIWFLIYKFKSLSFEMTECHVTNN